MVVYDYLFIGETARQSGRVVTGGNAGKVGEVNSVTAFHSSIEHWVNIQSLLLMSFDAERTWQP